MLQTPQQRWNRTIPLHVACKLKIDNRYTNNLIGDKGYIAEAEQEILKSVGTTLLTPFKTNALKNKYLSLEQRKQLYKRHKIENVFCRMDKFRRIFYRHDRFISSFATWHYLAMSIMTMEGLTRVNANKNYSRKAMMSRYIPKEDREVRV
jgi:transposase